MFHFVEKGSGACDEKPYFLTPLEMAQTTNSSIVLRPSQNVQ